MHLLTAIHHFSSCRNGMPPLILKAMKLTAIFLFAACMTCYATGLGQKVTLNEKNASLEKVFKEIRKQTGFDFLFSTQELKHATPVTISVKDISLEEVLRICLQGQPFAFIIENNTIIVKKKIQDAVTENVITKEEPAVAEITGRITNKEGEPLTGASVIVKRTGKGDVADANGRFKLANVNPNDVLEITYTGYKLQSIKVGDKTNFNIVLEVAIDELDRVQIQAYGKTSKRLATGNIATITAEEIAKQPVMNPLQALQGRVPGLTVTQTSGYGNAPFKVEIRGRNNINDRFTSEPLYIIDGVPLTIMELGNSSTSYSLGSSGFLQNGISVPALGQSPFFSLNPDDIESIEVLKDADATAIYGSRAANGAILINTKKGKVGKAKFDGSINQGISAVTRKWEMLNTQQYLEMRKEAFKNDNITITPSNAYDVVTWDNNRYTDWQEYSWGGIGKVTNAHIGLTGGSNQVTFRLNSGYNRRTDISTYSGADERLSLSSHLGYKTQNQRFGLTFSNIYSYSKSNMIFLGGSNLALLPPNAPDVLDTNGKLNYAGWQPAGYPFANLFQPYTSKTSFLNSSLNLNYEIIKGLSLRSNLGYSSALIKQTKFTPISSLDPTTSTPPTGIAQFGTNSVGNWVIEPQIEYSGFISKGKLNIMFGSTFQSNSTQGQSIEGTGYTSDLLLNTISNAPSKNANDYFGQYNYSAIFGRLTYNWLNKYILNLSARRDGSSRFGEDKLFGNFGSIGAVWLFSEENLVKKNIKFLSFGKLRGSYGTTGSDAIGDYKFLTRWSSTGYFSYGGISPLVPIQHSNNQYHWPTNRKLEAAIDLGLFENRLSVSVAWYRNRCDDQLIEFPLAGYTGFNTVVANSPANVQNMGWEFSITGTVLSSKNLNWSLNFNTGINRNKLLSYPSLELSPFANQYIVGEPLNFQRLLHYTGVDPQTGLYTVEDKTKDGAISTNFGPSDDRYIVDANPRFTGGLGSNLTVKSFNLSLFFQFVKQDGINALYSSGTTPGTINNTSIYVFNNRWRNAGDISNIAKFTTVPDNSFSHFYNSDGVYTNASFIRLSNIAFSYNFPSTLIKKAGLQSVQLSVNAQNLLTFTKYKGLDPETQNFGGMPPAKIITGGINFNF